MAILKHLGRYGEKRAIILYREVPGEPENCLIVEPAGLDDMRQDELMSAVQSSEAQSSVELSEALKRKTFSDGTTMLDELHHQRQIKKVPASLVTVTPTNDDRDDMPLTTLMEAIRAQTGNPVPPLTDSAHLKSQDLKGPNTPDGAIVDTDAELNNQRIDEQAKQSVDPASDQDVAKGMFIQANLMLEEAERMQKEAEEQKAKALEIDPSLSDS